MSHNGEGTGMKILFVGSEAAPYVKVGGLGEVLFSLPRALNRLGHDARVMIPRYAIIDGEKFKMKMIVEGMQVPSGNGEPIICNVKESVSDGGRESAVPAYFLENMEYFEKRANVYGYDDDAARWAVLCRGVLEFIRAHDGWRPDIIVAADWQGGLIPNYFHKNYKNDPILSKIPIVFSIHNLFYQANFDHHYVSEMDYDDGHSEVPPLSDPRLLKLNFMRRGIMHADVINTVSPTYAKEITTPEFGELLDPLLQERRARLFGILNGIDHQAYDPATDGRIEHKFSVKKISDRVGNKAVLRRQFNLPEPEGRDVPIFAVVSRLSEQKGLDLISEIIEPLLYEVDFQFIVLGTGDGRYISFFQELDKERTNVSTHLSYDNVLPYLIFAGADAILIPSRYEPCGLVQMEAMRYGAVPIVRRTGGLADSVEDYNSKEDTGTGFVFENYTPLALYGAIVRALEHYKNQKVWQGIQRRAMMADFSWDNSAREYVKLFEKAAMFHKQSQDKI